MVVSAGAGGAVGYAPVATALLHSPPEPILTMHRGEVYPDGARLAPVMISTPGHRVLRRRQRRAPPAWFSRWPVPSAAATASQDPEGDPCQDQARAGARASTAAAEAIRPAPRECCEATAWRALRSAEITAVSSWASSAGLSAARPAPRRGGVVVFYPRSANLHHELVRNLHRE